MTQYRPAHYRPEDLIDLARYPLGEPEGAAYRELVRAGQERLGEDGALVLPGFATPAAAAAMVREADFEGDGSIEAG